MTRPSDDDGPIRTCIGCRTRRPQSRLVRCVLDASGDVVVGRHAAGRGAWLCGPDCVDEARRKRAFDRAFRRPVDRVAVDRLHERLAEAGELND